MTRAWIYLFLAGACEMVWPLGFKYTRGFTAHHWATALTMAIMLLSFGLMALATKNGIHVGTAYAIWTGLGAAGTAILGMILFHEPRDVIRLACLGLIITGVVGLKFFSPEDQPAGNNAPRNPPPNSSELSVDSHRQIQILKALCNLPTAPYCEQYVIAWLLAWAKLQNGKIKSWQDRAGNVYLEYRGRKSRGNPLVIEAHMDHPGFIVQRQRRDGRIESHFRGGVKPSHFQKAHAKFWVPAAPARQAPSRDSLPGPPQGRWIPARVEKVKTLPKQRHLIVTLAPVEEKIPLGTLGMWDLPNARINGGLFAARVCDDLAGVAAIVCLLEELIAQKAQTHVLALCSRAEEVGFAGVLAVCENHGLPKSSPVIGLETSKGSAMAPQGHGPIIRVGDRTGIFSPGLTYFLSQTAGHIADKDATFKFQRKLMDGGTCNSTAFAAYGYDAAGICLALGNYHNMTIKNELGYSAPAAPFPPKVGPGIASETIHTQDFLGLVRLLTQAAQNIGDYEPGMGIIRRRLSKMHRTEQKTLLYARR